MSPKWLAWLVIVIMSQFRSSISLVLGDQLANWTFYNSDASFQMYKLVIPWYKNIFEPKSSAKSCKNPTLYDTYCHSLLSKIYPPAFQPFVSFFDLSYIIYFNEKAHYSPEQLNSYILQVLDFEGFQKELDSYILAQQNLIERNSGDPKVSLKHSEVPKNLNFIWLFLSDYPMSHPLRQDQLQNIDQAVKWLDGEWNITLWVSNKKSAELFLWKQNYKLKYRNRIKVADYQSALASSLVKNYIKNHISVGDFHAAEALLAYMLVYSMGGVYTSTEIDFMVPLSYFVEKHKMVVLSSHYGFLFDFIAMERQHPHFRGFSQKIIGVNKLHFDYPFIRWGMVSDLEVFFGEWNSYILDFLVKGGELFVITELASQKVLTNNAVLFRESSQMPPLVPMDTMRFYQMVVRSNFRRLKR